MGYQPLGAPDCYGSLWSPIEKECTGGPDPAYTHPGTGTHVRERCKFFQQCSSATSANRTQVVPASQLTQHLHPVQIQSRPGFLPPPTPRPMTVSFPQQPPPHPAAYNQYQHPMTLTQPWLAQQGAQQVPAPYQAHGAQMPSYLAVPEPAESAHWFVRLMREVFRSAAKSAGHTTASFFDHTPMVNHRGPEE